MRLGAINSRQRCIDHPGLLRAGQALERLLGVVGPDTGYRIAAAARSRGERALVFDDVYANQPSVQGDEHQALRELAVCPAPDEAVVLTTCNRAEIYVACEDTETTRCDLARFMSRFHDVPEQELAPHFYVHTGADVARHLFRVAAGLDSLVVGEPQIFGQDPFY